MIKKVLTSFGMVLSTFGQAQGTNEANTPAPSEEVTLEQLQMEIFEACKDFLPSREEFDRCVKIVSMDLAIVPHNAGGTKTCEEDQPCNESNDDTNE